MRAEFKSKALKSVNFLCGGYNAVKGLISWDITKYCQETLVQGKQENVLGKVGKLKS